MSRGLKTLGTAAMLPPPDVASKLAPRHGVKGLQPVEKRGDAPAREVGDFDITGTPPLPASPEGKSTGLPSSRLLKAPWSHRWHSP